MTPLSICMLTYEFPDSLDSAVVSGEVKNPYHLARGLVRNGHRVTIVSVPALSRNVQRAGPRNDCEFPTHDVPEGRLVALPRYALRVRNVAKYLPRVPGIGGFDVVHAQAPALAAAALSARRRGVLAPGTPIVTTGHGTNLLEADADGSFNLRQRLRIVNARGILLIDRAAFRASDGVVSVSEFQKTELAELYGVPNDRIHIVHNGIDLEHYRPSAPASSTDPSASPVILFVGRLVPKKGLQYLIRAFGAIAERHPGARCVVIGGSASFDTYGGSLRALASECGVADRITWLSEVPESELPEHFRRADVCAFPSEGYESLPTVVLEAMACGVPVVATRAWGTPEALGDDHPGLTPESDPTAVADAVLRLLDDVETRDRVVAEQAQRVSAFDLRTTVTYHERIYRDALSS